MTQTIRFALILAAATLAAACGGRHYDSSQIGPQGGTVTTSSGVTLKIAPGAVSSPTEIKVTETQPRDGAHRRIELEPKGLALASRSLVSVKVSGDASRMKLVEIEQSSSGEVEHALEVEQHNGKDNARQAEIEHLGTFEVRDAATCDVACDTGFECDDGVCKPHDEVEANDSVDDNGVDPAPAPGTTPTTCPDGMELDASDGICKPHGGTTDPAPAPAPSPTPTPTTCPAGMELDASDGICKPSGGTTSPAPAPAPSPTPTTCPDGMELDTSDGICKPHGGGGTGP